MSTNVGPVKNVSSSDPDVIDRIAGNPLCVMAIIAIVVPVLALSLVGLWVASVWAVGSIFS